MRLRFVVWGKFEVLYSCWFRLLRKNHTYLSNGKLPFLEIVPPELTAHGVQTCSMRKNIYAKLKISHTSSPTREGVPTSPASSEKIHFHSFTVVFTTRSPTSRHRRPRPTVAFSGETLGVLFQIHLASNLVMLLRRFPALPGIIEIVAAK